MDYTKAGMKCTRFKEVKIVSIQLTTPEKESIRLEDARIWCPVLKDKDEVPDLQGYWVCLEILNTTKSAVFFF